MTSLHIIDHLYLIARVAEVDAGHVIVALRGVEGHGGEQELGGVLLVFEGDFVLEGAVAHLDDVALVVDEALVGRVVLGAGVRPRVAVGRDQVAAVEGQGVVELEASSDDEFLEADAHSDPPFQLPYPEAHLDVACRSVGRLQQGEPLSVAAARFLGGDAAVDLDGRRPRCAPIVPDFAEDVGRYSQHFLRALQIALKGQLAEDGGERGQLLLGRLFVVPQLLFNRIVPVSLQCLDQLAQLFYLIARGVRLKRGSDVLLLPGAEGLVALLVDLVEVHVYLYLQLVEGALEVFPDLADLCRKAGPEDVQLGLQLESDLDGLLVAHLGHVLQELPQRDDEMAAVGAVLADGADEHAGAALAVEADHRELLEVGGPAAGGVLEVGEKLLDTHPILSQSRSLSQEDGIENGAVLLLLVRPAQLSNVHVAVLQHVHQVQPHFLRFLLLDVRQLQAFLPLHRFFLSRPLLARGGALLAVLEVADGVDGLVLHQLLDGGDAFLGFDGQRGELLVNGLDVDGVVVRLAEVADDGGEVMVLFLHFLVVAATLLGLPRADEQLHGLEDLVHAPHVPVHEVVVVDLQKPMVLLVLLSRPVPSVHVPQLL